MSRGMIFAAAVCFVSFTSPLAAANPDFCKSSSKYQTAVTLHDRAERAMIAKDYRSADGLLDVGLSALGHDKEDGPASFDDTGQMLGMARLMRETGKLKDAATLKKQVLDSRLDAFQYDHACKK